MDLKVRNVQSKNARNQSMMTVLVDEAGLLRRFGRCLMLPRTAGRDFFGAVFFARYGGSPSWSRDLRFFEVRALDTGCG